MGVGAAIVIGGLSVASAVGKYNSSKSTARNIKKQAAIEAHNRMEEIKKLTAEQRVRYISAGLELEGTPQEVINDTYNKGIADVWNIHANAKQNAKNVMTVARSQLIGDIASTAVKAMGSYNDYAGGTQIDGGELGGSQLTNSVGGK
jgi:hypothetical protein